MKKTLRLPAAALATSVALSGLAAVTPEFSPTANLNVLATAQAQSSDSIPDIYHIQKAPDAEDYSAELHTFLRISKARHLYHSASYDQKYANYLSAPQSVRDAADFSEQACFAAKSRVALAILKAEGNEEARKLDITKVGFDADVTAAAVKVLGEATEIARKKAFSDDPDHQAWAKRHKFFDEGFGRLKDLNAAIIAGTPDTKEADAFSVVDWGVAQSFVKKAETDNGYTLASLTGISLYSPPLPSKFDPAAAKAVARQNEAALAEEFGPITAPGSSTPKPGEGETPKPGEGETPKPGEGETPKPGEGETPKPGEGQNTDNASAAASAQEAKDAADKAKQAKEAAEAAAAAAAADAAKVAEAKQAAATAKTEADRAEAAATRAEKAAEAAKADKAAAEQARDAAQAAQKAAEAAQKAVEEALKKVPAGNETPQPSNPGTDNSAEAKKAAEDAKKAAGEAEAAAAQAAADAKKAEEAKAAAAKAEEAAKRAEEAAKKTEDDSAKAQAAAEKAAADRAKAEEAVAKAAADTEAAKKAHSEAEDAKKKADEASAKAQDDLKAAEKARADAQEAQKAAEKAQKAAEEAAKNASNGSQTDTGKKDEKKPETKKNGFYGFLERILGFSGIGGLLITILKSLGFLR